MKKFISFCLSVCIILMCIIPCTSYAQVTTCGELHIAADGNDANDGSINNPLKTFIAARNKAREIMAEYPDGVIIYVHGGTYDFTETLALTSADSNTIWCNYNGEKVTVTGAKTISGSFKKVTDESILNKVIDEAARDNLYYSDLSEFGVTDLGAPFLPGAYSYWDSAITKAYGLVKPTAPDLELFYNGNFQTIARYPNSGNIEIPSANIVHPGYHCEKDDITVDNPDALFKIRVEDERINSWNIPNKESKNKILMSGKWGASWADQTVHLGEIDNCVITSAIPSAFGVGSGIWKSIPFYVYNLIDEIDSPGEYYIDRDTNLLYFYPPDGNINSADVKLSFMSEKLVTVTKGENITISGIDFTASRNTAIEIQQYSNNNLITNCEISCTASRAVKIYGTNNEISNCHIYDVEGGVSVHGNGWSYHLQDLIPANNYVKNNHIERFSRLSQTYTSAVSMTEVGNWCINNKIHNGPHLAIDFSGQLNKIMYNEIYDVVKTASDMGAIYGGADWVCRGYEIKYNYFHDIDCALNPMDRYSDGDHHVYGIFLDAGQGDMAIEGNIFERVHTGIGINGNRDVIVKNNIFMDSPGGGIYFSDILKRLYDGGDLTLFNKMMSAYNNYNNGNPNTGHPKLDFANNEAWKEKLPNLNKMMALSDSEKVTPEDNAIQNNIMVNCNLSKNKHWDIIADPSDIFDYNNTVQYNESFDEAIFNDYADKDFTLADLNGIKAEIPDFTDIDFKRMGKSNGKFTLTDRGKTGFYNVTYYNKASGSINALFTGVIYKELAGGELQYERSVAMPIVLKGASYNDENIMINLPESKGYTIKGFLWERTSLKPLIAKGEERK